MKTMTSGKQKPAYRAAPTVPQAADESSTTGGSGQLERTTPDCGGLVHHENLTKFPSRAELNGRGGDLAGRALCELVGRTPAYLARLRERFDAKLTPEPNTGCWLWTGALNTSGYGVIGVGCLGHSRAIVSTAHRVGWLLHLGPLAPGQVLDHRCGTICCANPSHLEPVTPAENRRRQTARALRGAA